MDAEPADTEGQLCSGVLYKELEHLQILVSEWVLYPNPKHTCMFVLVAQSCPALCSSMDYSPPGSSVHGILLARILGLVAIPFSCHTGDLPDPGIQPGSTSLRVDSLPSEPPVKPINSNDPKSISSLEQMN